MEISLTLQTAIDTLAMGKSSTKIREYVAEISKRYRYELGKGKKLVQTPEEVVAYAISRMPATYCSVSSALEFMTQIYDGKIETLLDLGSGTGAVCWAAMDQFELGHITCVEREQNMIAIAKSLFGSDKKNSTDSFIENMDWIQSSVTSDLDLADYDLVTASYVMNELNEMDKVKFLKNAWDHSKDVILIIEPGTTVGYQNIKMARDYFLKQGAHIIAPCAHSKECSMENDTWCHFICRVERSRLQKYVKQGDAPYEDERFSYIAITKSETEMISQNRILFPPNIYKGYAEMKLCTTQGMQNVKITARDKAAYKKAKKAKWGETISTYDFGTINPK